MQASGKSTPEALDSANKDTSGPLNNTNGSEISVPVPSLDASGLLTQGDVHDAVNYMRNCILAVLDLPNFIVARLTVNRRDVDSIISPNWYTDAVIDVISQVALEESSNNVVFYQQAVAIVTYLGVVQEQNARYAILALHTLVQPSIY